MTEQQPAQTHLEPATTEQPEMAFGVALYKLVDDLFTHQAILPLLERTGDNPAIEALVADWKQALIKHLETAAQSMLVNAAAGLSNILDTGALTEAELAKWWQMEFWNKPFTISSLCRDDLKRFFSEEEIATLTDVDMETIADKMSEAHHNTDVYWESLELGTRTVLTIPFADDPPDTITL
jgi:hypothetical protein